MNIVVATTRATGWEPEDVSDLLQRLRDQGFQCKLEHASGITFVVITATAACFNTKFGVQLHRQRWFNVPASLPLPDWLGDTLRTKVPYIRMSHGGIEC